MEFRTPAPLKMEGNVAENWKRWLQKLEVFLVASGKNNEDDMVKIAILLNLIGDEALEVYNSFTFNKNDEKKFNKVIEKFAAYCQPKRNVLFERYKFYSAMQKDDQSIDQYLTEIKNLVKTCEFKESNEMVRDRLVIGIRDEAIKERLLREDKLTIEKAVEIYHAWELSKQQVQAMAVQNTTEVKIEVATVKKANISKKPQQEKSEMKESYDCKKCGRHHSRKECPAFGRRCTKCGKSNHFAIGCFKKNSNNLRVASKKQSRMVNEVNQDEEFFIDWLFCPGTEVNQISRQWSEEVTMEGQLVECKLDTGAQCNVLPSEIFKTLNCNNKLKLSKTKLTAYGNNKINVVGEAVLSCLVREKTHNIKFVITDSSRQTLLGLNTCEKLKLINRVEAVTSKESQKQKFVASHKCVFEGLGEFKEAYKLELVENAHSVVSPCRKVPEAIKPGLKKTIDNLLEKGIIAPVNKPTDWVNNFVAVEKKSGSIRLCLDPRHLNKNLKMNRFPIPSVEEIEVKLAGKSMFTVLDMKDGFLQIPLTEDSSYLTTFITPWGKYRFLRLAFGLSVSPEVFQSYNTKVFGDLPIGIYFDDLIIAGDNEIEHDILLEKVMRRAREAGIKFNVSKLQYKVKQVKYLGRIFSIEGVRPDPEQVEAILALEKPKTKKELMKVLGVFNYLGKFIRNLAHLTVSLRSLLKNNVEWQWTESHEKEFNILKEKLSMAPTLRIFDNNMPVEVFVDASQNGLGACLLQNKQPVAFISRSLSETEQRYAQIEKEFLAICFATQKFHHFVYGRNIEIYTDHKPIVAIVNKDLHKITMRLQRMKLKLLKYNLTIKYLPGKNNILADLLSRSYIKKEVVHDDTFQEVVHCVNTELSMSDNRLKQFKETTSKDETLKQLITYFKSGWPDSINKVRSDCKHFWNMRDSITCDNNNILCVGNKIIVPNSLRRMLLSLLHEAHLGINKTKNRARQLFYWPNMCKEIEEVIRKCWICEKHSRNNVKEPLISHIAPKLPFEKISMDILEFNSKSYLVVIDHYSKWLDLIKIKYKTAEEIIEKLKFIFSNWGIPREVISDNNPFGSSTFRNFANNWNFKLTTSSPNYPKSNGLAEKAVGIGKSLLKKAEEDNLDLSLMLLEYRNSLVANLDWSPAELLQSRKLRTKLPIANNLLVPKLSDCKLVQQRLEKNKLKDKKYYNRNASIRKPFLIGEQIWHKQNCNDVWRSGIVVKIDVNPRSYWIKDVSGRVLRRNSLFLKKRYSMPPVKVENKFKNDQKEPVRSSRIVLRPRYLNDYVV